MAKTGIIDDIYYGDISNLVKASKG